MKLNYQELTEKAKNEMENVKKTINFEAIKYIDRKVLIAVGTILFILIVLFYYWLFFIYSPVSEKTSDKTPVQTPPGAQQIINKQATTSLYSSMKPNTYSNISNSTQTGADVYKIPANYMDVTRVSAAETDNYVKVFDIVYDYIKEVNNGNYQNALLYLNRDFAAKNKITWDILSKYHKDTYFPVNTFVINSVVKSNNVYTVTLFVSDKNAAGVGFDINYKITETNGKLDISIDDLEMYVKK